MSPRGPGRPAAVRIRLLTSVCGDGPVAGNTGDVLDVDAATAAVWADGERAELVVEPSAGTETRSDGW